MEKKKIFKLTLFVNVFLQACICIATMMLYFKIKTATSNGGFGLDGLFGLLNGSLNTLNILYTIYVLTLICIICGVIYSVYHKKQKLFKKFQRLTVIYIISNLIFVAISFKPFSIIRIFLTMQNNALSGNFNFFNSGNDLAALIPDAITFTKISFVFLFILIAVSLVFSYTIYKEKNIDYTKFKAGLTRMILKIRSLSPKSKKIIVGLTVVCVLMGGTTIYFTKIKKSNVDIIDDIKIKYDGVSGEATAEVDKSNIKKTDNAEVNEFIDQYIDYDISKSSGLKNGEKITLTLSPDLEMMKKYKINIKNLNKSFTVSNLNEYAKSIKEIKGIDDLKKQATVLTMETYKDEIKTTDYVKNGSIDYVESCYSSNNYKDDYAFGSNNMTKLMHIFKISYSTELLGDWEKTTYYTYIDNDNEILINPKKEIAEKIKLNSSNSSNESIKDIKGDFNGDYKCIVLK